ncbi:hypothetical protein pclt_cds_248 [Pandoravirus celtis]|uniref:F-box incomplete domain containing protein n=1 Tax=Pandoravirus celtis TaxID=2568002 RepID=A0A4D6EG72_9VIRU|nr:hypothetical protein pclt_cds_248 [Pandoravirus celtis]
MANIGALPIELVDMILNGLDANGVPFFDPRWRFAARATHRLWRDVIAAPEPVGTRTRTKAFSRAWRAPSGDGSDDEYDCQCDYNQHDDFKTSLAVGRIVSARCAVGRPWVMAWCSEDGVPPQDRAAVALLSLPAPVADAGLVHDLVAPHIQGDESTGPFPVRPLRRDFWQHLKRAHPDDGDDDNDKNSGGGWSSCDSEFLYDAICILCEWNRPDLMRPLMDAYASLRVIDNVFFRACSDGIVETVEDALVHADRLCDGGAKPGPTKWRVWKEAVRWGGTCVLERLLGLCAHSQVDVDDKQHGDRCREAALSRMARLARPKTDLAWQKCAVRYGNVDALIVGERYGVPIRVHELIETAGARGSNKTVRWLLARVSRVYDPPTTAALAHGCAAALDEIVATADYRDRRCDAHDVCQCRKRPRRKASRDDDDDDDGAVPKTQRTVDALCDVMGSLLTTDEGVAAVRRFLNAYLGRTQHTPDGIALVVRAIERWPTSVAGRIKPLGWRALVRAAVTTGATDALNRITSLMSVRSSCDPSEIDLWGIAVDRLSDAVCAALPPLPFVYCGKCPTLSLLYKRDRAAAMVAHLLGIAYGETFVSEEATAQTWRALCRPRPVAATVLGDPAQDSPLMASLRALMGVRGLVYS